MLNKKAEYTENQIDSFIDCPDQFSLEILIILSGLVDYPKIL